MIVLMWIESRAVIVDIGRFRFFVIYLFIEKISSRFVVRRGAMTTTTENISGASKSSWTSKNFSEHIVRIENVEIRYFLLGIAPSIQTLQFSVWLWWCHLVFQQNLSYHKKKKKKKKLVDLLCLKYFHP